MFLQFKEVYRRPFPYVLYVDVKVEFVKKNKKYKKIIKYLKPLGQKVSR